MRHDPVVFDGAVRLPAACSYPLLLAGGEDQAMAPGQALVELFSGGAGWGAASRALGGAFHPAVAATHPLNAAARKLKHAFTVAF